LLKISLVVIYANLRLGMQAFLILSL